MTEAKSASGSVDLLLPAHADHDRCIVMGVLNVTPDSFSDGGRWCRAADAVRHGMGLVDDGADIVDVGGESTRPGADRVPVDEELRRVVPVVTDLAALGVAVSVDTTRSTVAEKAVLAGATMVNDVSGGQADPSMLRFVADAGIAYVVMHSRGPSRDMRSRASYHDVVAEVVGELGGRVDAALDAGVSADRIVIDPGLGFSKLPEHDWRILACFNRLTCFGLPVLIGASRKSFLADPASSAEVGSRPPHLRDDMTAAITALVAAAGAWGVRVHAVRPSHEATAVASKLRTAHDAETGRLPGPTAKRRFGGLPRE